MDPIILVLWLLPTLLFLGSFVIAKRVSRTGLRFFDLAVIIWGVAGPTVMMQWPDVFQRWTGWSGTNETFVEAWIFIVTPSLVTALVLGLAMRSWIPVGFTLAAGIVTPFGAVLVPDMHIAAMLIWNIIVAGGMVTWGCLERVPRKGVCGSCGYSLAGLRSERCPECGAGVRPGAEMGG
ncbi:MAG: hypothetical protein IT436_14755 [Phycisphaerales bacterium]|nr:hypothetical protein [Phycisphaerales bacterium]